MPRKQKNASEAENEPINSAEDEMQENTQTKDDEMQENSASESKTDFNAETKKDILKAADSGTNGEYVDYCLPFLPGRKKGDSHTVTINGKNYQVQYGVPVKVPSGVKEILEGMVMQNEMVERKIRELTKEERCLAKFK